MDGDDDAGDTGEVGEPGELRSASDWTTLGSSSVRCFELKAMASSCGNSSSCYGHRVG